MVYYISTLYDKCGGTMKVTTCIEDPDVIQKILAHLDADRTGTPSPVYLAQSRALP